MKTLKLTVIMLALCLTVPHIQAQEMARITEVVIFSRELNQQRKLLVYTPSSYDEETLVKYEVIYVFDSNNREFFDFVHSAVSFVSDLSHKFIVVGILPTYIEEPLYGRNHDLLPKPVNVPPESFFGGIEGNRDNFMRYVKNEVVPYIDQNYRTGERNIAVGHSLSASFVISCFIEENGLFDDYFAVSPNLAYDDKRLLNEFTGFDFDGLTRKRFFFVSSADEGDYWQGWEEAADDFHAFAEGPDSPEAITFVTARYPQLSHWPTFAYAMVEALPHYFPFLEERRNEYSDQVYEITVTLRVPDQSDVVYITGNQPELGNWNPEAIRMERISDYERRATLQMHSPAQIKFTRGSWDSQSWLEGHTGYDNLIVFPDRQKDLTLEVYEWSDNED